MKDSKYHIYLLFSVCWESYSYQCCSRTSHGYTRKPYLCHLIFTRRCRSPICRGLHGFSCRALYIAFCQYHYVVELPLRSWIYVHFGFYFKQSGEPMHFHLTFFPWDLKILSWDLEILSSDWLGKTGRASKFENNQYEYQTTRAMAHILPKKHVNHLLEGLIHLFQYYRKACYPARYVRYLISHLRYITNN